MWTGTQQCYHERLSPRGSTFLFLSFHFAIDFVTGIFINLVVIINNNNQICRYVPFAKLQSRWLHCHHLMWPWYVTTRCWGNSIGFWVDFKLALLVYKVLHDLTAVQHIVLMTVSSSLTSTVAGYNRPTSTCVVFHGPTHGSATGALWPLDRSFGTVCRPGFASQTMRLENFVDR